MYHSNITENLSEQFTTLAVQWRGNRLNSADPINNLVKGACGHIFTPIDTSMTTMMCPMCFKQVKLEPLSRRSLEQGDALVVCGLRVVQQYETTMRSNSALTAEKFRISMELEQQKQKQAYSDRAHAREIQQLRQEKEELMRQLQMMQHHAQNSSQEEMSSSAQQPSSSVAEPILQELTFHLQETSGIYNDFHCSYPWNQFKPREDGLCGKMSFISKITGSVLEEISVLGYQDGHIEVSVRGRNADLFKDYIESCGISTEDNEHIAQGIFIAKSPQELSAIARVLEGNQLPKEQYMLLQKWIQAGTWQEPEDILQNLSLSHSTSHAYLNMPEESLNRVSFPGNFGSFKCTRRWHPFTPQPDGLCKEMQFQRMNYDSFFRQISVMGYVDGRIEIGLYSPEKLLFRHFLHQMGLPIPENFSGSYITKTTTELHRVGDLLRNTKGLPPQEHALIQELIRTARFS